MRVFRLLIVAASLASRSAAQESPLDKKITLKMKRVPLQAFLKEVGRQAGIDFNFDPGLEKCAVTAFIKDQPAKKSLQMLLEIGGISYQQIGSSYLFVVSPRKGKPVCPAPPQLARPKGKCRTVAGEPIALRCESAPLVDFAEKVHDAKGTGFFFPNKGEALPVTAKLNGASYVDAIAVLAKVPSLAVRRYGADIFVLQRTEK